MYPRLRVGLVLLVALTVLAAAGTARATPATPVTITSNFSFVNPTSPFTATGGIVCAAGTVSNVFTLFTGFQSNTHAQILVLHRFTCTDGTFDILLRVTLSLTDFSSAGTWSVHGGTGAYSKLHGTGKIAGVNQGDSVLDSYAGRMHID